MFSQMLFQSPRAAPVASPSNSSSVLGPPLSIGNDAAIIVQGMHFTNSVSGLIYIFFIFHLSVLLQIQTMLQLTKDINKYSRNKEDGDCYKFEDVLANAFNEFDDVDAHSIGGAGNTDIECMYLTIDEKFAIEAKSTQTKLGGINAGRLQLHRNKINAKYTIIVAPYYKPSVEMDIANTLNVMITASSLSNFLYQYSVHSKDNSISYKPLYDIVQTSLGTNITSKVNDYVCRNFGIGRVCS